MNILGKRSDLYSTANDPETVNDPQNGPFLFLFFRDHLRSTLGIAYGRGSFAVNFGDHLPYRDHLWLGFICGNVQICHFHARAIARRRKARFPLRMCRILFAAKHMRPLFHWHSANEKKEKFALNDNNNCYY